LYDNVQPNKNIDHVLFIRAYIHFDDEDLREYVIVDPAYLIEVLRSIVTEKLFWPKSETLQKIFEKLSTTG
jgi:hypothetical protein